MYLPPIANWLLPWSVGALIVHWALACLGSGPGSIMLGAEIFSTVYGVL